MMFESEAFQKFTFTDEQIVHLKESACRDFQIVEESPILEVRFKFLYDALIKIGLFLIAQKGYRVRSNTGHHVKVLEKMSDIMLDDDIAVLGNVMRRKRNRDLYEGISSISEKEVGEFVSFIGSLLKRIGER